jgi:hypothetical protein
MHGSVMSTGMAAALAGTKQEFTLAAACFSAAVQLQTDVKVHLSK